jgi:hypothetical protein
MISDDPDEDADTRDDQTVMDQFLDQSAGEHDAPQGASALHNGPIDPHWGAIDQDWPPQQAFALQQDLASIIDPGTLTWFKSNHADWRMAMGAVLRAWIEARRQTQPDVQTRG